ncbi:arsenite efflux transporter metallochaperone ArsD [Tessaracoccus flavus]|uniref:Arsenical resistance operon transcriptional repressor ArsD n=1 Tax=Tessaracoccus flavus TaxID=1610493 RepID=A0A1Q2CHS0_9ACTN|nr:arsenite efflux transporter metallochaperone ArsD [Tessaracoccus flavus]AQP45605.1 arsenical resistance operon transcriptional repressor ArsD [Tessaracoccus flavus]SDY77557.1 Arsenical resistance operon trans-acting repressor ArsD [Tessaracoccus flavus]
MPAIHVFEPALCCNTGVCGPELDESLVRFTADLDHLRSAGVDITRHNLANDPTAFATNPVVVNFLQVAGSPGLPLVLVDDVTVAAGRYPSRAELLRYAERPELGDLGLASAGSCCGSGPDDTAEVATGCCGGAPESAAARAACC